MELEKTFDNYRWYKSGNVKFRIKELPNKESILWAICDNYDLCAKLLFWDFFDRCDDELSLLIQIDKSWQLTGYKISEDAHLLMGEIIFFLSEWKIKTDQDDNKIEDNQWYST